VLAFVHPRSNGPEVDVPQCAVAVVHVPAPPRVVPFPDQ
jgi:hypothetical protein